MRTPRQNANESLNMTKEEIDPVVPVVTDEEKPLLPAVVSIPSGVTYTSSEEQWFHERPLLYLLHKSWPMVLRGASVAARYFVNSKFLADVNEKFLGPNALISQIDGVYMIFGGRALAPLSSIVGKLYGEIKKCREELEQENVSIERQDILQQLIKEKSEQIGLVCRHGMLLGVAFGVPLGLLSYFLSHHLVQWLGQHDFSVETAQSFFQAIAPGYVLLNVFTAQQRLLQGIQEPIPVMLSQMAHSVFCLAFSYLFLFGKLGFPELGMAGVGYAFVIGTAITLVLHTLYLGFKKSAQEYRFFSLIGGFDRALLVDLAKNGFNTGIQNTSENIASAVNTFFLGLHSLTALAADQMSANLALFLSIAVAGLAQAASSCVAKAVGKKEFDLVKRYGNMTILLAASIPVAAFVVMLFAREQYISLFINRDNPDNAQLNSLASSFLLLECMRQFVTALQLSTATGGLLGLKDTEYTMQTSMNYSLRLNAEIVFVLHYVLHGNSLEIFSAKAIGMGVAALLNLGRWLVESHKQSPEDKAALKDRSYAYQLGRSVRMFVCGGEAKAAVEQSLSLDV